MEPRLMKESHEDYTRMMRQRYARRPGRRARSVFLDEYCRSTGLERKYAVKVLGGKRRPGRRRGDPPSREIYTASDVKVLKAVWMGGGAAVWQTVFWGHAGVVAGLVGERRRIAKISAAQIDRELAPYRSKGRRRRVGSGTLAAMQREIAVRCETVVRDSASSEIEEALPFTLRKLDFDNGLEFLNGYFVGHFKAREPKVESSRSRPYRKNDNAHIEQKNYTHVRLLLGDDRFDRRELVEPRNEVLKEWSQWNNLCGAQRRLLRKERGADGRVRRHPLRCPSRMRHHAGDCQPPRRTG